jgi:hypothetical protein
MTLELTRADNGSAHTALRRAIVGAVGVLIIASLRSYEPWPLVWVPGVLLGLWLCVASLIGYLRARPHASTALMPRRRFIPLRFSGTTGRFQLRPRGDGRRVEVLAGEDLVVEVNAAGMEDEIILHVDAVPDRELGDLGAAIGEAIESAAAADEDPPDCCFHLEEQAGWPTAE